jgi:hypothetical protein
MAGMALCLAASTACAGSNAPARPAVGSKVQFCGTVVSLVEDGCIGVKPASASEPTYQVTSAKPKPKIGALIAGSGRVSGGMSFCMQGVMLENVTWKPVKTCAADDSRK